MAEIINFIPDGDVYGFFAKEKSKVVRYVMKHYELSEDEANDCFQEGCIAMWKNIKSGKLTKKNLTCSLSSYLMSCCCNHATHEIEKKQKFVPGDIIFTKDSSQGLDDDDESFNANAKSFVPTTSSSTETEIEDAQMQLLADTIKELPEPCNTILWNVYFNYHEVEETLEGKETIMDAIALMIGYSKSSLKAKKSFCMNKLKTKINSLLNQ